MGVSSLEEREQKLMEGGQQEKMAGPGFRGGLCEREEYGMDSTAQDCC